MNFTRRSASVLAALVVGSLLVTPTAVAATQSPPGAVDLGFGSCGIRQPQVTPPGYEHLTEGVSGIAVQPDGRILLASRRSLTRLLADGRTDHTFGDQGFLATAVPGATDLSQTGITLQPDGRFLVGSSLGIGSDDAALSRYLPDGRPDPSFGVGGHVTNVPGPVAMLLTDGRIISLQGDTVVRLTRSGALDPTFGTGGTATIGPGWINRAALQPDGGIVISHVTADVPEERRLLRLSPAGVLDPTFGTAGVVPTPRPTDIVVDSQGRIVWITTPYDQRGWWIELHRLLPDGQPDPSVEPTADSDRLVGWPVSHSASAVALQADDRLVVAGSENRGHGLFRLDHAGHLDHAFGLTAGSTLTFGDHEAGQFGSLVPTPAGDWLLAGLIDNGANHPAVVRFRGAAADSAGLPTPTTCTKSVDGSFNRVNFGDVPVGFTSAPRTFVFRSTGTAPVRISRAVLATFYSDQYRIRADTCSGATMAPGATCAVSVSFAPLSTPQTALYTQLSLWDDGPGGATASLSGGARGALATQSWGWNVAGQLGNGSATATASRSPVVIPDSVALAAGYYHSLALRPDGTVWAWGWNHFGQLGDGSVADHALPAPVPGLTGVVAIAAGAYHSLAVTSDGSVFAWGMNNVGQLGDGTTTDRRRPVRVGVAPVTSVTGGGYHTLAVASDGTVWSWGWNNFGQLGDGTTISRAVPKPLPALGVARAVAGGGFHSLALLEDDSVRSWGLNHAGQLGDGTTTDRHQPVLVPLPPGRYEDLTAGAYHSIAAGPGSSTLGWGWNAYGQVGDGTTVTRLSPVLVNVPAGIPNTRQVGAGVAHTVLVGHDGRVWGWGWNGLEQLGPGAVDDHIPEVVVPGGLSSVAAGAFHTLAG